MHAILWSLEARSDVPLCQEAISLSEMLGHSLSALHLELGLEPQVHLLRNRSVRPRIDALSMPVLPVGDCIGLPYVFLFLILNMALTLAQGPHLQVFGKWFWPLTLSIPLFFCSIICWVLLDDHRLVPEAASRFELPCPILMSHPRCGAGDPDCSHIGHV